MNPLDGLVKDLKLARENAGKMQADLQSAATAAAADVMPRNAGLQVTPTSNGAKVTFQIPPGTRVKGLDRFAARAGDRVGVAAKDVATRAVDRSLS